MHETTAMKKNVTSHDTQLKIILYHTILYLVFKVNGTQFCIFIKINCFTNIFQYELHVPHSDF